MKTSATFLAFLAAVASAKELAFSAAAHGPYASGEVMDNMMMRKEADWGYYREQGYFAPGKYKSANAFKECGRDGTVTLPTGGNNTYRCSNFDVTGHLTHDDLGSTDPTERIGMSCPHTSSPDI